MVSAGVDGTNRRVHPESSRSVVASTHRKRPCHHLVSKVRRSLDSLGWAWARFGGQAADAKAMKRLGRLGLPFGFLERSYPPRKVDAALAAPILRLEHQPRCRACGALQSIAARFRAKAFGHCFAHLASCETSYNQEAGDSAIRREGRRRIRPEVELDSSISGSFDEPRREARLR